MNVMNRARRIAEAAGNAVALDIDGTPTVVCYDRTREAIRLAESQMERIDVVSSESVCTCNVCGEPILANVFGYPPKWAGWVEDHDANGQFVGWLCEAHK